LSALDMPQEPYPVQSEDLNQLVALVEGSPAYLTRRMQAVETRLAGSKKVVLSSSPTALAEKLQAIKELKEVRLWPHPYEVLQERNTATPEMVQTVRTAMAPFMLRFPTPGNRDRRVALAEEHPIFMGQAQGDQHAADQAPLEIQWCSLWMGRAMHFKGIYESEGKVDGALEQYLAAMTKDTEVDEMIQKFVLAARLQDEKVVQSFRASMREVIPLAKRNAIYWLGLIAHDRGKLSASVDHLQRAADRELGGPWRRGATYNLARTYEEQAAQAKDPQDAEKLLREAIKLLESDDQDPQALGNRLRARSLQDKLDRSSTARHGPQD
jgi:tetratricopeptide (TPR) repeat protein